MSQESPRASDPAGYLSNKTIVALCTPTGGALCVLRISGEKALKYSSSLTDVDFSVLEVAAWERRAKRVWVKDQNKKIIDDAVMVAYCGPRSFTGEDSVEFFLHGSPIVAQKLLEEFFKLGARLALPGEFSFRAVKNGKLSLSQAEAIKELVKAENDFALDLALEKLSGSQHELILRLRDELMQLVTLAEAGIDFSDQDLDEVSLPRLKMRLKEILNWLQELQGSFDRGKLFIEGVGVSLFGLPNAGKSSFFNALLCEDRSIVSAVAGTTRDVVKEKINLGPVTFKVADTAGLRKSGDQIEEIGIERSLKSARDADFILVIVDASEPSFEVIKKYLSQINLSEKKVLGVLTKKDLVKKEQLEAILSQASAMLEAPWVVVSAAPQGAMIEGIHDVATKMIEQAQGLLLRKPGEVVLTQIEHVQAARGSLKCLERAMFATDIVLFATDVRHGMNELGPLIGETVADDILGKIFSDFCIGK